MAPLPVGLSDYWTIAMFNILYQDWSTTLFDVLYQYSYKFTRV